jgi:hypothetical protein
MSEWLQNHNDCPQCRREYLKSDAECSVEEDEEKVDGDDDDGNDGNGGVVAANRFSTRAAVGARPSGDEDDGDMDNVDLERGEFGGASLRPSAADLELPQWYRETIPGIGLRYSSAR